MAIELHVAGLPPQDGGRGVARLSETAMEELGIDPGDVVRIEGRRMTVAKAVTGYGSDPDDVVRIDGTTRANAGVRIDEHVTVEAVEVEPAESMTVALPPNVFLQGAEPYVRYALVDRPLIRGDTIRMGLLGQPFVFVVTKTEPSGPVIVTEETAVTIRDKPISEDDLRGDRTEIADITYEDIGGLGPELEKVREMIELPLRHPELFRKLGIAPPKGVLLHGPPGTGKTLLAKAVANEIDASFHSISGPEIMSKYYGESEGQLREVFEEAEQNAPAIVFIDEIDSIAPKREDAGGEVERRVVAQLLSLMDGLEARGDVIVIGATNRVDAIDPALRRGGRFDREIEIGVPDERGRHEILQIHTRSMPLAEDVDLESLAAETYGFVGADLESLAKEAAMSAVRRVRDDLDLEDEVIPAEKLNSIEVTDADFRSGLGDVVPSAMREVFVEIPDVTWDDVGGLESVKRELVRAVEWPLRYPEIFDRVHTEPPRGVLLYGPPGTGKTLLARAVANASSANFISVKGPEVLDKYVGESERAVREIFSRARQNAPTVVFFDEVDAIAPERGGSFDSRVTERVVSQLLTELDGIEELKNVVVVAATNRPDVLDRALLRPGRLEKLVYVPTPDVDARRQILAVHTRDVPLAEDVNVDELAESLDGYTGSDIEALVREASMLAIEEYVDEGLPEEGTEGPADEAEGPEDEGEAGAPALDEDIIVDADHFAEAVAKLRPSVTPDTREFYDDIVEQLGGRTDVDLEDVSLGFQ